MKRPLRYAGLAGMLMLGLAEIAPVLAQSGPVPPPARAPRLVGPDEVLTIVRSTQLTPLERPTRRGVTYALRAVDAEGDQVRVIVDARTGAILAVTPIARQDLAPGPGFATAPRSGTLPPDINTGPAVAPGPNMRRTPEPDGYIGPGPRAAPPVIYESSPPMIYGPRPPAVVPGAPTAGVPRDDDTSSPQIIAPEPGSGMLPPPPERFPQRVAPGPEPKAKPAPPRRSVSAAPPKSPPLPKPRPEARVVQPPAAAPAAPSRPPVAPPPAPEPSADDVPH